MPPPTPPISQRLRTVRRRVTIAVLATFAAAWLAVAAFGKGGAESGGTAASASPQTTSSDDGGYGGADNAAPSDDSGASPAPLTTSQS
jgi:hypothetical protein